MFSDMSFFQFRQKFQPEKVLKLKSFQLKFLFECFSEFTIPKITNFLSANI